MKRAILPVQRPSISCSYRLLVLVLLALLVCRSEPGTANVAVGDLDPNFGAEAMVTTDILAGGEIRSLVIQPDGKILAVGWAGTTVVQDFAMVRYDSDGTLDSSFGSRGTVTTDFGGHAALAYAVAVQPDGRIVVAGNTQKTDAVSSNDFALARYNIDGTLDTAFGDGGKVTTDFFGDTDTARAVALQADGKIVVAGGIVGSNGLAFGLTRYKADGTLDLPFGAGGKVVDVFFGCAAKAISIQADGKIVAAGAAPGRNQDTDFGLARYNPDGSLDTAFGANGHVATDFFGKYDDASAVTIQPDGKIVASGRAGIGGAAYDNAFAVARYNSDGSLDSTFGVGGKTTTDFPGVQDNAFALALQPDGKIVLAGQSLDQRSLFNFALARYNANGTLDSGFGSQGKLTTAVEGNCIAFGVALQHDGKIIAAGAAIFSLALIRYNGDGSRDFSFHSGGRVTTDLMGGGAEALAIAIQSDGEIVAAGSATRPGGPFLFALTRYKTDGSLDQSFGSGGKVVTDVAGMGAPSAAFALAIQPDGKIIAAGYAIQASTVFALVRYNADGSLDSRFGNGGIVTTDFLDTFQQASATAIVLQPDGKIVAVGSAATGFIGQSPRLAIARYNTDGSLDSSFGAAGKVTTKVLDDSRARAVTLQSDGRIVAVGSAASSSLSGLLPSKIVVARYNPDGSLDNSFGTGGEVVMDFFGFGSTAYAAVLQADAKIIVAGTAQSNGPLQDNPALARFNPDGSLDSSFGSGGKVAAHLPGGAATAYAITIQGSRIITAGYADRDFVGRSFALVAFKVADGTLDSSFGSGGSVTTMFSGRSSTAHALATSPDGWIVAAGGDSNRFALARYLGEPGSGPSFDICVQDGGTGNLFKFNSRTGDYLFKECGGAGFTAAGKGRVKVKKAGCVFKLSDSQADRTVAASINTCKRFGSASITVISTGRTLDVGASTIGDGTCKCP